MTRWYVGVCRRSEILELFLGVSGTQWRSTKLTAAMSTSQTLGVPRGCLSGFPSSCTSVSWKRVSFLASGGSGNHQLPHPLGAGRGLGVQASPLNPGAGALETGTAGLLPSHLLLWPSGPGPKAWCVSCKVPSLASCLWRQVCTCQRLAHWAAMEARAVWSRESL